MSFTVTGVSGNLKRRLNLYSTSDLSDVTITCNGREFRAHSFVLSEASDFFHSMLCSNFKEGQAGHRMTLDVISCDLMEMMLPYFYGADVKLSHENLLDVLMLADMWMLDELKTACEEEFSKIITHENALQMREIAITYRCPEEVVHDCEEKLFEGFDKDVKKNQHFVLMHPDLVRKYFVDYQCKIQEELDVLLALYRWYMHDEDRRIENLNELLSVCVRREKLDKNLARHFEFVKPHLTDNNPFMTYVSSLSSDDRAVARFPPARCAAVNRRDKILLCYTFRGKKALHFVKCRITGFNENFVFDEHLDNIPHKGTVRDAFALASSGKKTYVFFKTSQWYLWKSKEGRVSPFSKSQFVIRKHGSDNQFLLLEKNVNKNVLISFVEIHNAKPGYVTLVKGQILAAEIPGTNDGSLLYERYMTFSNKLVGFYLSNNGLLEVRAFDLKTFKMTQKTTVNQHIISEIKAITQKNELFVIITDDKCFLLSFIAEKDNPRFSGLTEFPFPIEEAHYCDYLVSACIVGHLLVVALVGEAFDNSDRMRVFTYDLNIVLGYAKGEKDSVDRNPEAFWTWMKLQGTNPQDVTGLFLECSY